MPPFTHYYGLLGDAHESGNRTSALAEVGSTRVRVMGISEQELDLLDLSANLGSLAVNDILEQIPLGISIRARVVKILSNTTVQATVIVEPVAGDAATNVYPGAPVDDPGWAWDTYAGMNINGVPATAVITSVRNSQFVEQLNDPRMREVTAQKVFYDPQLKRARAITIDNYTHTPNSDYILPGDQLSTSGGATFIVVGVVHDSATSTATLYVARESGTLTVGHTLTNDQVIRSIASASITSVGAVSSAGEWTEFCAIPSLGRSIGGAENDYLDNPYEIPPRGNARVGRAGLGPELNIIRNAVRHHEKAAAPDDRGVRVLTYSAIDDAVGQGQLAGVTLQLVEVSGVSGTFVAGEGLTAGTSGWTGTVAGTNGTDKIYVLEVNGVTLTSGETLTGSQSGATATSTGPALGWQPGSLFWNNFVAYRAAAAAAPGALEGAAAARWEGLFLMIWEGEVGPYAQIGNTAGFAMLGYVALNPELARKQWVDFIAALRTELGNSEMPVSLWKHHSGSQSTVLSGAGVVSGVVTAGTRARFDELPKFIDNLTVVDSEERGHEMVYVDDGDADLYLRTLDYVDLGNLFWHQLIEPTLVAPPGNYKVLPVVVCAGSQSQARGSSIYNSGGRGWAHVDRDPELWPSVDFLDHKNQFVDTRDENVLSWNFATQELEVYDVNKNENTAWQSQSTNPTTGPFPPIMQRFKARFGDGSGGSGPIGLFKFAISGSCLNPSITQAAACWSPSLTTRPALGPVVCVISHVTVGATTYARFTATPGIFDSVVNGQSITIRGSSGQQFAGGNNTLDYGFNTAVTTNSTDGSFIDIVDDDGTAFTDGAESLSFVVGPPPAWPEFESQWRKFVGKCVERGYIPQPVALIQEQGESDLALASDYATHLDEFWDAFIALCSLRQQNSDQGIAKCIVGLHRFSPFTEDETEIESIRAAQIAKAAALPDCKFVDPSDLAFDVNEFGLVLSTPPYPRRYRLENGIHHTGRSMLTKGYMIDRALGELTALIPDHPEAPDVLTFGAVVGVAGAELGAEDGAEAPVLESVDVGVDGPSVLVPSASQEEDFQAALNDSPDIAAYTTATGDSVTRRSVDELLQLERAQREAKARKQGFRGRTRVRFA